MPLHLNCFVLLYDSFMIRTGTAAGGKTCKTPPLGAACAV